MVDERARNERVWSEFIERLPRYSTSPLRILEVGSGDGATAERILDVLHERPEHTVEYTLVDVESEHLDAATDRLRQWAWERDCDVTQEGGGLTLSGPINARLDFIPADLFDFTRTCDDRFDAIVAQAVLDILPLKDALDRLGRLLLDGGLWYLPIHFDGVTAFEPSIASPLDAQIEERYHQSMSDTESGEEGGIAGAKTGRRLLDRFRRGASALLAAGSSDWVVFARDGEYPNQEKYFLHHILQFIEQELSGHPDLDPDAFNRWVATRRRQIEQGDLIYVAHQLDVLAQEGGSA